MKREEYTMNSRIGGSVGMGGNKRRRKKEGVVDHPISLRKDESGDLMSPVSYTKVGKGRYSNGSYVSFYLTNKKTAKYVNKKTGKKESYEKHERRKFKEGISKKTIKKPNFGGLIKNK